jgi:hypothetical protein
VTQWLSSPRVYSFVSEMLLVKVFWTLLLLTTTATTTTEVSSSDLNESISATNEQPSLTSNIIKVKKKKSKKDEVTEGKFAMEQLTLLGSNISP